MHQRIFARNSRKSSPEGPIRRLRPLIDMRRLRAVAIVCLLLGAGSCATSPSTPGSTQEAEPTSQSPTRPSVEDRPLALPGVLVPYRSSELSFGQAGVVVEKMVRPGTRVEAGQVLARLEATAAEDAIQLARARLAIVSAELTQLEAGPSQEQIAVAEAAVEVAKARLREVVFRYQLRFSADAELVLEEARLQSLLAGATDEELALARARVAQAELLLEQAIEAIDRLSMHSPYSGVVASIYVEVGEYVLANTPAMLLQDPSLWAIRSTEVKDLDLLQIREGQRVQVVMEALPDRPFEGEISSIEPMAQGLGNVAGHSITVQLLEHDQSLRWGMAAMVLIALDA